MYTFENLYIGGQWVAPKSGQYHEINNPATEHTCARTPFANDDDVVAAIDAASAAFPAWSKTSAAERCEFINAAADRMDHRAHDFADAITTTMGCPKGLAIDIQVKGAIEGLRSFATLAHKIEEVEESEYCSITREAVGVCTLINPWNYPLGQLAGKLGPALAAGCTVFANPAEHTPVQEFLIAEVLDVVGLPPGVFNLITGSGRKLGKTLCGHSKVDMVSLTGSAVAGVKVSEAAAPTIKRVCLELGGKSPFIITEDADLSAAVRYGVEDVMVNSGQTCNALTRMLVPQANYAEAVSIAKAVAEEFVVGDPQDMETTMGPLSSEAQRKTVVAFIEKGIAEGARLVTGGPSRPKGVAKGAYVLPTIFADVDNKMEIAREEIFGPVLCMIPYGDIGEAIEMANDSIYGLSSAVYARNEGDAMAIAHQLRAGQCYIQGAYFNSNAPFGGYKQSGNGREWGTHGLDEYLELKAIIAT